MLLAYGNTVCSLDWQIDERIPTGYCRVYYVLGGEVHYEDSQQRLCLQRDHLYIFPSAAPYHMRQNAENPLCCTFIHIDVFPSMVTDLIECPVNDGSALKHTLLALSCAIEAEDQALLHALVDVLEQYAYAHQLIAPPVHALSRILLFIDSHIDQEMTVGQLSAMAGYNEQYFIRLFRRHVGQTPYQYIISHRLKVAKALLRKRETVSRAAEMTGYSDIKSFGRAFRQSVGMSPSAFRKDYTVQP